MCNNVDGCIVFCFGLVVKYFIDIGVGVIDVDYCGLVKVFLFNYVDFDFEVKEGDWIVQLIVEWIFIFEVVEVQELEESVRGVGGFGSMGGFGVVVVFVVNQVFVLMMVNNSWSWV